MPATPLPYTGSLTLLTDLYELTMAYGYWRSGMEEHEAVFDLVFREHPFRGGFTIACGLGPAIEFLQRFRFDQSDLDYLGSLRADDGSPLLGRDFLDWLAGMELSADIDAVPEGTVVFPQEPLIRVQGPLIQCQVLESALLNIINFQSLIATKGARVSMAAQGEPVLEFGLRRAQGVDGALAVSRAAYVGGCAATSNVLAGKLFGIPVKGTHAHSWVMSFDTEAEAFQAYAEALPNNSVFLVDTYDTLAGVRQAIRAGKWLCEHGHNLDGIRLDSGDLAALSIEARRLLDEAGFRDAKIVASGDLDEHAISDLKKRGAAIGIWGVGTRLATAYDDPALGGVYKLSAIRETGGEWRHKVKLSDEPAKVSNPGALQVRRFRTADHFVGDIIYNELNPPQGPWAMIDPKDEASRSTFPEDCQSEDLLVPVFRRGACVHQTSSLDAIRQRVQGQLACLQTDVKRLKDPAPYLVGLEEGLHRLKQDLISRARRSFKETR